MNQNKVIQEIQDYVKENFEKESTGHDWWHSFRVWKLSKKIAEKEGGNLFIIELAALLHDISDWKFNKGGTERGVGKIRNLLEKSGADEKTIKHVCQIIKNISFKGAFVKNKIKTKEGKIVQDADRLESLGAIGIARTFAFGGFKKRQIYNPEIKPKLHKSFKEYKNSKSTSINHFYEKKLLLKDRLNTKTAKKIAKRRHKFLENYLKEFFKEWRVEL